METFVVAYIVLAIYLFGVCAAGMYGAILTLRTGMQTGKKVVTVSDYTKIPMTCRSGSHGIVAGAAVNDRHHCSSTSCCHTGRPGRALRNSIHQKGSVSGHEAIHGLPPAAPGRSAHICVLLLLLCRCLRRSASTMSRLVDLPQSRGSLPCQHLCFPATQSVGEHLALTAAPLHPQQQDTFATCSPG